MPISDLRPPESFLYEESGGVGTITLNRPDKLNALTFQVYDELAGFFQKLGCHPVRVVVITGAGRGFCAGGDVKEIIGALFEMTPRERLEFTRMTCQLIRNIRTLEKPVIASLNGVAAGAGAVIALASDIRIACEHARIGFVFTKVGLSGADMGATFLLPRVVGLSRATEILMTGEFITPQDALAMGLYHRLVPSADLARETRAFAEKLAAGPPFGLAMTKIMLNRELSMDLENALEAEAQAQALCMEHSEFRTAYEANQAKRPPTYA